MSLLPKQIDGLEIGNAADGYVVFHAARDRVHYLNHTAILILELCNGENSAQDIADFLQSSYSLGDIPLTDVQACVDSLIREGLIV